MVKETSEKSNSQLMQTNQIKTLKSGRRTALKGGTLRRVDSGVVHSPDRELHTGTEEMQKEATSK